MTERTCAACDNPVKDTDTICRRCETQTRYALADMPAHYGELLVTLAKQIRMNAPNDGGKGSDPALSWGKVGDMYLAGADAVAAEGEWVVAALKAAPPAVPYAKNAGVAIHSMRALLVSWCRLLEEEAGVALPADTVPALASHMIRNMPTLRRHEAVGELVQEVRELVKRVVRVVDTPENRARFHVGPCPEVDRESVPCPGQVEALVPHDESVRPRMVCRGCGVVWYAEEWARAGERILRKRNRQVQRSEVA